MRENKPTQPARGGKVTVPPAPTPGMAYDWVVPETRALPFRAQRAVPAASTRADRRVPDADRQLLARFLRSAARHYEGRGAVAISPYTARVIADLLESVVVTLRGT